MERKKIVIDGKNVFIEEGKINPMETGVVSIKKRKFEDTLEMKKVKSEDLEDTIKINTVLEESN